MSHLTTKNNQETDNSMGNLKEIFGEDIAPNGYLKSYNFEQWFSKSVMVDEDGSPLVVHHGTNQTFESFDSTLLGMSNQTESSRLAFFFTDSKSVAESYAEKAAKTMLPNAVEHEEIICSYLKRIEEAEKRSNYKLSEKLTQEMEALESDAMTAPISGQKIYSVYLKIENPLIIDDANGINVVDYVLSAKEGGFDGVIMKNIIDDPSQSGISSNQYAVFDSTQIKSILNTGDFNTLNNDMNDSGKVANDLDRAYAAIEFINSSASIKNKHRP